MLARYFENGFVEIQTANLQTLGQIKAELIPLDSKFRVATDSVAIRKMPRTYSEVIKEIGMGSIIQIIGKLPSGWMQVAKEGESMAGYIEIPLQ
jgi:hypothetical protein